MKKWNPIVIVIAFVLAIVSFAGCKSKLAEITALEVAGVKADLTTVKNGSVEVEVPYGTDLTKAVVNIVVSPKATVSPASGTPVDLSDGFESYVVTSENGKIANKLAVTVRLAPNTEAEITDFQVGGQTKVNIDPAGKITVEVMYSTDLTKMAPALVISEGATINPASGTVVDFSSGSATYTVTAQDGVTTKDWTVTVTKAAANTGADIVKCWLSEIADTSGKNEVNAEKREVHLAAIYDVYKPGQIKEDFFKMELSLGATYTLKGDFPGTAICTVTSEDGKTVKEWKITVVVAKPDKTINLTKFVLNGQEAEIDSVAHTVRLAVAPDVPLNSVIVTDWKGDFGKMVPDLGDTLDFSDGAKKFTLVAQDTTVVQKWTIAVFHLLPVDDEYAKRAVICNGDGVENPLMRQIALNPVFWGYTGTLSDSTSLKKWIGAEAHRRAIKTGYVNFKTGEEVRVGKAGTMYVLEGDGDITEYTNLEDYTKKNPSESNSAAASFKEAKFAGADKEREKHIQKYEYVFNPLSQVAKVKALVKDAEPVSPTVPTPAPKPDSTQTGVKKTNDGSVSVPVLFNNLPPVPVFSASE
ncbi:MAG: DUF5018 domain-containing protein [Patescibacteria group bacterium]|nr:DUF5018 domain-containing protein [Patescibacteria group bacterium]